MITTGTTGTRSGAVARLSSRRRAALVLALAGVAVGVGVPAVVAAQQPPSVEVMGPGLVGTDVGALTMVYRGDAVTAEQLEDLNADGKAMVGVHSPELSCQGIALYVDTPAEADDYGRGYTARAKTLDDEAAGDLGTADPCAGYEDAPRFLEP